MLRCLTLTVFALSFGSAIFAASTAEAKKDKPGRPGISVPELDPTAAGAAIALLVGGAAVLYSGRRKQT